MKKFLCLLVFIIVSLLMSSCFFFEKSTVHPDMVEYSFEEVLDSAKEKYQVKRWIFQDKYQNITGEFIKKEDGTFEIVDYSLQFATKFTNGDNIENAFTAFAGKNGGHDVQGTYSHFLCYIALAECEDGSLKYIYYNTNIHKSKQLADTIGASDYTFEVSPLEIKDEIFVTQDNFVQMNSYLNKRFTKKKPTNYTYSGEKLMLCYHEGYSARVELEFYKENEKIVFDIYYKEDYKQSDRQLIYSTSEKYGVIFDYYGFDKSKYFDVSYTVTQSTEDENCMLLKGYVKLKETEGTLLYSRIQTQATFNILFLDNLTTREKKETEFNNAEFEKRYLIEKIEGIDHISSATFTVSDFYILYEK